MAKNPFQNFVIRTRAGEAVFHEGDIGSTMYIVQSGAVRLFRELDGQRRDLGTMGKGDFFGEMSILEGLPRTHSAEAAEDAELIEINSATFDKMIKSNIEIAIRMLRKLSIRLRAAENLAHAASSSSTRAAVPTVVGDASSAAGPRTGSRLEAEEGDEVFPLCEAETWIGRFDPVTDQKPDVDLTELDLKRSVSRRHARVVENPDGGHTVVEEVGALNGTFVNGTRLNAGEPHAIQDGDRLGFGMVKLIFRR